MMRAPGLIVLCILLAASACTAFTGSDGPRVASVAMSQDSLVVAVGASAQVTASPKDDAGQVLAGVPVAWTSSDTMVATVSQAGIVAGRGQGQATITAKAGSRTGTTRVRVASQPTVRIVSGAGGTDTVQHRGEPLIVEVRDSTGAPARGVAVWFTSRMMSPAAGCAALHPGGCHSSPGVALGSSEWVSAVVETDVQGRAAVPVRMGTVAGPTEVEVAVYRFGLSQAAPFTVAPGAPARIVRSPADTALYVGASFVPRTTVLDRFGNVPSTAVAVTFDPADPGVAVAGGAVGAVAIGRSKVVVRAGAGADSIMVSVVPRGVLAVTYPRGNVIGDLGVVELDGSGLRKLVSLNSPLNVAPAWSPDGARLLVTDRTSEYTGMWPLFAVDAAAGTRTLLPENPDVIGQAGPAYSRDGAWVYYTGMLPQQDFTLWRMRPDGTGHQQLRPREWAPARTVRLSPSRDGTRAVFESPFEWRLSLLDLQTLSVTRLGVMGRSPRWSPVADLIAYIADDGSIRGVLPDGSGDRALSPAGRGYWPEVDWSPDGKYLISLSAQSGVLEVIDPTTRTAIPLPFTRNLRNPAWKP